MIDKLKINLKKIKLFFKLNAFYKSKLFDFKLKQLEAYYSYKKQCRIDYIYNDTEVIKLAKKNLSRKLNLNESNIGSPNILYAGTNEFQDRVIIRGLKKIGNVETIIRDNKKYGLHSMPLNPKNFLYDKETNIKNSQILLKNIELKSKEKVIHILIGQFWANYLPKETLRAISEMGIIVINISMDDMLPEHWSVYKGTKLGSIGLASTVDFTLSTTKKCCEYYFLDNCPAFYWPLASDPEIFNKSSDDIIEKNLDVIFVGARYGIREELVNYLLKNKIKVEAYGSGWENGYISPSMTAKLFQKSKIILGLGTIGYSSKHYTLKCRDFDAPMSGTCYITHRNEDLKTLYKENIEAVFYKDKFECLKKIKYYLKNHTERELIGKNGQIRAQKDHTFEIRFREVIDIIRRALP
tara:strand:- start:3561 stop:4790 length:1230 start_codon:yes stop_codon:yes gene_type:complete